MNAAPPLTDAPDATTEPTSAPEVATPRRTAGAVTLGAVLVVIGALWLLAALDVELPLSVIGPAVLIVIGVGVVASALRGESDGGAVGLIGFLGVVLAVGALASTTLDVPLGGGLGDRLHAPASIEQLDDSYRLFAGTLTLDLRDVAFPAGTTVVRVSTVLGEVRVQLPADVAVAVDGSVAAGSAEVFGRTSDGIAVDADRRSDDWDTASRRVELRARVGLGELHVTR